MDGNRFDDLTRGLATGTSRRTFAKRSIAVVATLTGLGAATDNSAARDRSTPTPAPIRCPGSQIPCGSKCCCRAGTKCGTECCPNGNQCCDGACCAGTCYGEELCCPTGQLVCDGVCLAEGDCCTDADCTVHGRYWTCGVEAPNVCGCQTATCEAAGFNCGPLLDGECNHELDCGTCEAPQTCGGGGQVGVCGCESGTACGAGCCDGACYGNGLCCPTGRIVCDGVCLASDQCCTDADCHPANQWMKCGIVAPHVCTCLNTSTCASVGYNCGLLLLGDCDITLYCGECTAPDTCGGGGEVNVCGRP